MPASSDAAAAQIAAMQGGLQASQAAANNAIAALTGATQQAVPYYQTNWGTAQQGVGALGDVLGLTGPAGGQNALARLVTTPGYQFQLGQGENAINAAAAAGGTLGSGNQLMDLMKYGQGLAQQTYQDYVRNLQPYLGLSGSTAAGLGGLYSALGANEANIYSNLGQQQTELLAGMGNAQASTDLANQAMNLGLLGGGLNFIGSGGLGQIVSAIKGAGNALSALLPAAIFA